MSPFHSTAFVEKFPFHSTAFVVEMSPFHSTAFVEMSPLRPTAFVEKFPFYSACIGAIPLLVRKESVSEPPTPQATSPQPPTNPIIEELREAGVTCIKYEELEIQKELGSVSLLSAPQSMTEFFTNNTMQRLICALEARNCV